MKPHRPTRAATIRRSVALPRALVEEVRDAVPPRGPATFNALVRVALEEYRDRRREEAFAREMEAMAADPRMQKVNAEINREFECTLADGLAAFPWTGGEPEDPAARAPDPRRPARRGRRRRP